MQARVTAAGHAVHPMLIVLPLGLTWTALAFDVVDAVKDDGRFGTAAFFMIGAAVITGIVTAATGTLDWLAVPRDSRAWRVGLVHGLGNDLMLVLLGLAWWARLDGTVHSATALSTTLLAAAVVLSAVTGWLGGELVERLSVSVAPNAHVDAPSSLSDHRVIDLRHPAEKDAESEEALARSWAPR